MRARLHPAWHLLWALPLAAALAWVFGLGAGLAVWGSRGCSVDEGCASTGRWLLPVGLLVASGAALGAPLYFVPWTRRRGIRLALAALVGAGWAIIAWLMITA